MSTRKSPGYRAVRDAWQAEFRRREAALRNGGAGLVPVCCERCGRAIATTAVDRARGEPAVLLDFPDNAGGWTCTVCHRQRQVMHES